jgi:hypothetical protein
MVTTKRLLTLTLLENDEELRANGVARTMSNGFPGEVDSEMCALSRFPRSSNILLNSSPS